MAKNPARKSASGAAAPKAAVRAAPAKHAEVARLDLRDLRSIEQIMKIMGKTDILELEIQDGADQRLRLSRRGNDPVVTYAAAMPQPPARAADAADAPAATAAARAADTAVEFVSPMVGTFYRAASPEAQPYVVPGDRVSPDTVICIIEAMKVLNEIRAERSGEIVDVLVENGEAVEFGQPLFHIRPLGS